MCLKITQTGNVEAQRSQNPTDLETTCEVTQGFVVRGHYSGTHRLPRQPRLPQIFGYAYPSPATSAINHHHNSRCKLPCRPMHLYRGAWRVLSRGDIFISPAKRTLAKVGSLHSDSKASRFSRPSNNKGRTYLRRPIQPKMAPPRPALEKQYMSSGTKPAKQVAEPRPSSSFVSLLSLPINL